MTVTSKEVEACSEKKHLKKWDSGAKKELEALRSRNVFDELTTEKFDTLMQFLLSCSVFCHDVSRVQFAVDFTDFNFSHANCLLNPQRMRI